MGLLISPGPLFCQGCCPHRTIRGNMTSSSPRDKVFHQEIHLLAGIYHSHSIMTEESQKMSYQIVAMILVCLQMTASQEGIWIQQSPAQIELTPGKSARIDCKLSAVIAAVLWYKELQNGSLHGIFQSYKNAPAQGKYSSEVNEALDTFSLIIKDAQRNDSGVYYCGLAAYAYPNFGSGTRLIVTDASETRLSLLVPSTWEDTDLPHDVPLLCLISDFTPSWSVLWDTGEGNSEGQTDAGAIDGDGIYSVWSLTTVQSKRWNQETTWTCTIKDNSTARNISATIAKKTDEAGEGICDSVLYLGLLCIFILVIIQLMILLFRKRLTRGNLFITLPAPQQPFIACLVTVLSFFSSRESCENREANAHEADSTD
ncbi:immunoglobulin gamma-1 heavy chain-like isoform X1 [Pelodiscus sinensis]|uniref:immunoglobulin gamma-1 heavy chain-like isoform X1 n=1 Tax=Pelodiscus sinensis TaxID=13735 RepID=UPI003F6AA1FD